MRLIVHQIRPKSRRAILHGLRDNGEQQRNMSEASFVKGHMAPERLATAHSRW